MNPPYSLTSTFEGRQWCRCQHQEARSRLSLEVSLAPPAPLPRPPPSASPSCPSSSPPPPAACLPSPPPPSPPSGSAFAPACRFPLAGALTPYQLHENKEKEREKDDNYETNTLCCSATLAGRGEREERPSPRRTSTIKRESRERRRAMREEVTLEEMLGTSLPPLPLGTYFTPASLPPLSMPAVPIMGSELFSGG